jgi:transposase
MTGQEAAEMLGLSLRHTRRLIAAYRKEGAAVLAHGDRGKRSPRRTPEVVERKMVALAKGQYHDYNTCHFTDELEERHGITVSSSTVRRVRQRHGRSHRSVQADRLASRSAPSLGMPWQVCARLSLGPSGRGGLTPAGYATGCCRSLVGGFPSQVKFKVYLE